MKLRDWVLAGILMSLNIPAWTLVSDLSRAAPLEIKFLNIGEGDAILIRRSPMTRVLIDGGPGKKVLEKIPRILFFKEVDMAVLTHPDRDHMEGLIEILSKRDVDEVYWTGVRKNSELFSSWKKALKETGVKQDIAKRGVKVKAGEAVFNTLYPPEDISGKLVKEGNKTSVVLRLVFGKTSFLFTGDIPIEEESKIIEDSLVSADVLKVAHHGSKTSSSSAFLKSVSPQISVIQAGRKSSYHPAEEIVTRLKEVDSRVFTTKKEDIEILSDGKNLVIR